MKTLSQYFLILCGSVMLLCGCGQKRYEASQARTQITFVTTEGDITVELYNETPLHRDNFITQVRRGHFDSLLFHRVIRDFMIQGGDPTSKNAPKGTFIGDESSNPLIPAEFRYPKFYHKRGALAAAREGDNVNPERMSSAFQFYIVWGRAFPTDELLDRMDNIQFSYSGIHMDSTLREYYRTNPGTPHLDGSYTVFGEVVDGLDVVDKIQSSKTDSRDRPLVDIRILRAYIRK